MRSMILRRVAFVARGRRRIPFRSGGHRRKSDWAAFVDEIFVLGTTAVQLGATGFTTTLGEETLARIHGELLVTLETGDAVGSGFHGAIGIGKVQDEAFQAGVGSVPDPITEVGWDGWLYHQFFMVIAQNATASALVAGGGATFRATIDGKAMRRVDEEDTLIVVMNAVEAGTATGRLRIKTRALSLLA